MMRIIASIILAGTALATLYSIHLLKPSTTTAYVFFLVFLLLPYLLFAYALFKESLTSKRRVVSVILICTLTLYALIDTLYIHPDPQGGIFIFMLPMLQGIAFVICMAVGAVMGQSGQEMVE